MNFYEKNGFSFLSFKHTSILKGIAIIMVLLPHMGHEFGIRYFAPLGGTGVAIFLVLSAYGLSESYKRNGLLNFWENRFLKLLIPYVIIRLIYMLLTKTWPGILNVILDVTFIKPLNPNGWYLTLLLFWYIIFYFIYKIEILRDKRIEIFLLISICLLFIPYELWAEQAFSFTIGILLSVYKEKLKIVVSKQYSVSFMMGILIVGLFFFGIKQIVIVRILPLQIIYWIQIMYKVSFAIFMILFIFKIRFWLQFRLCSEIGLISYELYLIHGYFLNILNPLEYGSIFTFLLIGIGLSIILHLICQLLYKLIFKKEKKVMYD